MDLRGHVTDGKTQFLSSTNCHLLVNYSANYLIEVNKISQQFVTATVIYHDSYANLVQQSCINPKRRYIYEK